MKIIIFLIVSLFILGCNSETKNRKKQSLKVEEVVKEKEYHHYFSFDKVEHYSVDKSFRPTFSSENDSLKMLDNALLKKLKVIEDTLFLDSLEMSGYQKKVIEPTKYGQINSIFSEKPVTEYGATECVPIYRDILVFREKNKIVGMAKICFECQKHNIVGTNANVSTFPVNRAFQRLENILKDKKR